MRNLLVKTIHYDRYTDTQNKQIKNKPKLITKNWQ